ncbi:MAG: ribose-phosphate pyrophosphokinase [Planctomycetes bacterium]|nr:ribose-phosphate pyrophosphokinase [Planctomycetota bacterium]
MAMLIFSGSSHPNLAKAICEYLGMNLGKIELDKFPDSETKVRILDDVRGLETFVVQSLSCPVNESLMELLIIVDALKRASARRVCAVIPYYAYARQDRKHAGRVPITAKLVANMLVTSGVDRVLTMDLHSTQIQGFFDIPMDHLFAAPVHIEYLRKMALKSPVVMSSDIGSIKMADSFARRLGGELAVVHKRRIGDSQVEVGHVIGDIKKRDVIIVDDMITTAGSICEAIKAAKEHGANKVMALATHGVLVGEAFNRLREADLDELIITDTIPLEKKPQGINLTVLSVANILGEAVTRIHNNKSVSLLFV